MSSLTINQEKQIRALKKANPLMALNTNSTSIVLAHVDTYVELADHVREYRSLEKKWGEKATARRQELLKEIDLCLAVLGET